EILTRAAEVRDRVVQMGRRQMIEVGRLEARSGQDQDGAALPAPGGGVDDPGPARYPTEAEAIAAVERVRGVAADAAKAGKTRDEHRAAQLALALVAADEAGDPPRADVGAGRVRGGQGKHRPAAVRVRVLHP